MKIAVFTSNATRHKWVANALTAKADESIVITETKKSDAPTKPLSELSRIERSFADRYVAEQQFFGESEVFNARTIPIVWGEINSDLVYHAVNSFAPDVAFVFGSSIIKNRLLTTIPYGRFINMHLGFSPYYRGSGTNFWPFVNRELEYIAATILHIDAGVDTGDIICHARPQIELGDTINTIGNKTIRAGTEKLLECLERIRCGEKLQRVRQWEVNVPRYYKATDITEASIDTYERNMASGLIEEHLRKTRVPLRTIDLD